MTEQPSLCNTLTRRLGKDRTKFHIKEDSLDRADLYTFWLKEERDKWLL